MNKTLPAGWTMALIHFTITMYLHNSSGWDSRGTQGRVEYRAYSTLVLAPAEGLVGPSGPLPSEGYFL